MYFLYKCVFGFCHEIDKGEIVDDVNPMGIWVTKIFIGVLCDLTSSTHEAKKDRRPKEEHGKKAHQRRYITCMHIILCVLK